MSELPNISELATRIEFIEDRIMDNLETMKETQQRICTDISKIKEAVYNPDIGLYARLRVVEQEKQTQKKFTFLLISLLAGTLTAIIASFVNF
jgi:hypothetical protein